LSDMGSSFASNQPHAESYDKESTVDGPVVLNGTRYALDKKGLSGKDRYKFHLQRFQMDDELLQYIQRASVFNLPEDKLESNGFKKEIDYPTKLNHNYYLGYFHSLPKEGPQYSLNPRIFEPFDKPAAPIELRAFYTAFREVNDFKSLRDKLPEGNTRKQFDRSWHFADLAIQIHFGDEIKDKLLGWHQDSINSMLHLAMAVEGCRGLHVVHIQDNEEKEEYIANRPGDVYLSSPYVFRHAVHYPYTKSFSDRIVAIQARFLLDMDTLNRDTDAMHIITNWLNETEVRLPTYAEVIEVEQKIKDGAYNESEAAKPQEDEEEK